MKKLITCTSIIVFALSILNVNSQNKTVDWYQVIEGPGYEENPHSLVKNNSNDLIIRGVFENNLSLGDTVLYSQTAYATTYFAKLNSSGELQWAKQIPDNIMTFRIHTNILSVDDSNNIYLFGNNYEDSIAVDDTVIYFDNAGYYLAKFNTNGELIWIINDHIIADYNWGLEIRIDAQGYILMLSENPNGYYLSKISPNGIVIWNKAINGMCVEASIVTDPNNSIIFTARVEDSQVTVGDSVFYITNGQQIFIKFNRVGDVLWGKSFMFFEVASLNTTIDSNIVVTADIISLPEEDVDIMGGILILDFDGNYISSDEVWMPLGTTFITYDFIYLAGFSDDHSRQEILKYSLDGELQWEKKISITGNYRLRTFIHAEDEIFYFSGSFWDSIELENITLTASQNSDGLLFKSSVTELVTFADLCMVTVDIETGKNMLVWEKSEVSNINSYNIYRETVETNVFEIIDSVLFEDGGLYVDESSNPLQKSDKYKIASKNEAGDLAELSFAHKTIHLTANLGINREVNLIWSEYEGIVVPTYNIWRSSANNEFMKIGSVPGNSFSFSDLSPPTGNLHYNIEAINPFPCEIVKNSKELYASSISNTIDIDATNTNDISLLKNLSIYPNPSTGIINVSIESSKNQNINIQIISLHGKTLYEKNIIGKNIINESVNLSEYNPGIYILKIASKKDIFHKKIILK